MEDELEKAVAELIEAYDFFMDISEFTTEEMVEAMEERAPSFIEHIEMMEEPPKTASEFLDGFFICGPLVGSERNTATFGTRRSIPIFTRKLTKSDLKMLSLKVVLWGEK